MRIRIEYNPEGGGDPKAIELYSLGEIRQLTYEAMDEVLKTDISEAELTSITRLLDSTNVAPFPQEDGPYWLADSITLIYESRGRHVKFSWAKCPPPQWAGLCSELEHLSKQYFTPRFY
jgi:hypothetical protein